MSARTLNRFGQPIGEALPDWTPPGKPSRRMLAGTYCRLEALDAERHAEPICDALSLDFDGRNWTYLPYGPFDSRESCRAWLEGWSGLEDPLFFAIVDKADEAASGLASYLNISPRRGSIEMGHIHFSERLKRTAAATEAMYLMMRRVFALGYRRCEWKCDALNVASRAAAERLGFSYEGTFRQAAVYKGRSRDTAWYSVIDAEWPCLAQAFERWLDPSNFEPSGAQRSRLSELTRAVLEEGRRE